MVALGLLESVADTLVEPLVGALVAEHPGIEMRVLTAYSGHLQHWLDAGDVDLSLLYNLGSTPSLSVVPLVDEELWAVAPPGSGLDVDTPLAWSSLLTQRLVLPVPGHGLRTLIDQTLAHLDMGPDIVAQVNSMRLQKLLVAQGHGWTVLPAVGVAQDAAAGVLDGAPLTTPVVGRHVVLGLPRSGRVTPPVRAVATAIVRTVRTLVRSGSWPGTASD
jgi:DNA-binding transcriptional LysR family regulator